MKSELAQWEIVFVLICSLMVFVAPDAHADDFASDAFGALMVLVTSLAVVLGIGLLAVESELFCPAPTAVQPTDEDDPRTPLVSTRLGRERSLEREKAADKAVLLPEVVSPLHIPVHLTAPDETFGHDDGVEEACDAKDPAPTPTAGPSAVAAADAKPAPPPRREAKTGGIRPRKMIPAARDPAQVAAQTRAIALAYLLK